ncbi:hypothetical protein [Streptomyces sp. NBC_00203]|uniref:hypothetical protein n=1 Tax=Streptomyces sp. NBC_00203 TaxID=2975680 RepID=UPI003863798D
MCPVRSKGYGKLAGVRLTRRPGWRGRRAAGRVAFLTGLHERQVRSHLAHGTGL